MNKKGIVESGAVFMYSVFVSALIIAQQAGAPILFSGGNPSGSAFLAAANVLTVYSQMPHVKEKFRKGRAVEICEFNGGGDCDSVVAALNDEQVLEMIRDDGSAKTKAFYAQAPKVKSGGGLRAKVLSWQK